MILEGIIQKDGYTVLTDGGNKYFLPTMGTGKDGYNEVIIDAKPIGGDGWMHRQSIKPYIGMRVSFEGNKKTNIGFNYTIIPDENNKIENAKEKPQFYSDYSLANTIKKAADMDISVIEAIIEAASLNKDYIKHNKEGSYKERTDYIINGLNIFYNLKR